MAEELINRRINQILLHGYLYYVMDESIVLDAEYDAWLKELLELISKYPEVFKAHALAPLFEGFDGGSAFDIVSKAQPIAHRAHHVLHYYRSIAKDVR